MGLLEVPGWNPNGKKKKEKQSYNKSGMNPTKKKGIERGKSATTFLSWFWISL